MKQVSIMATLVLCLTLAAASGFSQNLIRNSSFEYPQFATRGGWPVSDGAVGLEWRVVWAETVGESQAGSPGVLEIWRLMDVPPRDGLQLVELDTQERSGTNNANVQIYQTVVTCPGVPYNLAYSWMPRPGIAQSSQSVTVSWAGVALATHTGQNLPWTDEATQVSGTFGPQQLAFTAGGTGDGLGMLLDAVALTGPDPNQPNACTTVNIKPNSNPNSINTCSAGSVPVTIWGSATFDVTTIDPSTLLLGGAAVNTVGKTVRYQCSISDSGSRAIDSFDNVGLPDGYPDLTCHFETAADMFPVGAITATVTMQACTNGFAEGCSGKPSTVTTATDSVNIVKENCL